MPSTATLLSLSVIFVLLLAATRRFRTAAAFTAFTAVTILVASEVKQSFLDMPLTLADFRVFMLAPVENFKLFLNYPLLGGEIVVIIALAVTVIAAGVRLERPSAFLARLEGDISLRTATAGACAALIAIIYVGLIGNVRADRPNNGDAWAAFLAMEEVEHAMGPMQRLNFFFDNRDTYVSLPSQRAQSRFPIGDAVAGLPAQNESSASARPDIMVVLEESTFDPELIARCDLPVCKGRFLQPAPAPVRTQQGPLLVHSTGGGTWLSEFAFLSGFDWRIFGRGGAFAPVSLSPRLKISLPKYLHTLGYRTVGIYPVDGNFLSAQMAYRNYGFDEFYSAQDFGFDSDWHKIRDADVFAKALQRIEHGADDRPVFAFILTIRNHGPHGLPVDSIPRTLQAAERKLDRGLADYLARYQDSSADYSSLRDVWLNSSRRRVIGWFGDHQPETAWNFINTVSDLNANHLPPNVPDNQLRYLTYYQLSANYDGSESGRSRNALDISYLQSQLLKFAGLPLDAGAAAATQTASACAGLLYGCADSDLVSDYLSYRVYQLHAIE
ncbi:MAG: sulfatase-like hydrolase/transferase [Gammaproteobacteria bacterium]